MKVTDFINGKVVYGAQGQYLWIEGNSNGVRLLAELRGWGAIQNMFVKDGKPDVDTAVAFQDEIGEWVAQAINEKLERDKKN